MNRTDEEILNNFFTELQRKRMERFSESERTIINESVIGGYCLAKMELQKVVESKDEEITRLNGELENLAQISADNTTLSLEIESLRKELERAKEHQTIIQMPTVLGNIPSEEADEIINALADLREVVNLTNESEQLEIISSPASVAEYAKREIISLRTQLNGLVEELENLSTCDFNKDGGVTANRNSGIWISWFVVQELIKKVKENK